MFLSMNYFAWTLRQLMDLALNQLKNKLCNSQRAFSAEAEDNTLRDLHNSSDHNQLHLIIAREL